jgi:hypothetical protein
MPQLWLTFEEIADLFYCDTAGARRRVIANQWERRRYGDGLTRALLPAEVAHEFMLRYRSKHEPLGAAVDEFDAAMAALRRVFSETETDKGAEDLLRQPGAMTRESRAIRSPCPIEVGSARPSLRRSAGVKGEVVCEQPVAVRSGDIERCGDAAA